jgi:type IV pilus assembly protein PilQ
MASEESKDAMRALSILLVGLVAAVSTLGSRPFLVARADERPRREEAPSRVTGGAAADVADDGDHRDEEPVRVQGISFERRDGRDRLVVELSGRVPYRVVADEGQPARLRLGGARLDPNAPTALTPRGDGGTVRSVRLRETGAGVVVEVDRRGRHGGTALRRGQQVVWLFPPPPPSDRPATRTIAREELPDLGPGYLPIPGQDRQDAADQDAAEARERGAADGAFETAETADVAAFLTDVPLQVRPSRGRGRYSGRRIDLDFKDADIHNILRLLAEVGGVNVVTSDDVSGTVTIRMRNVPWDQALDVILQAKGLGMVRRGNLIRVAPLETLEKEREAAIARQKQNEQLAPLETRLVPVSYATAGDLQPRVQELLSERGSVSVDERTNVLIARDIVENLDEVEELVRTLDTQTPQVLVEARIVEATSSYVRDVGIQWGGDVSFGTAFGNPTGLTFPSSIGVAGGNVDEQTPVGGLSPFGAANANQAPNFAVNLPAITGTGIGGALGLTFGSLDGNINLNVRLSAAESTGTVRIISSPRILTLDNQEAHIAQGTLIPYSQVSAQGVQTAFQEAKLELRVRPHVTSDGSVAMKVKITRDEPDFTNQSVRGDPTILKREAETDLLLPDGDTAVIGGIYTRNTGRNLDAVPFFADIPILGVLFQRRRIADDRNELLIFLTPRIVNRSEALRE